MNVIELNKYRPAIFRRGRFLREDWTSCSQIGETWNGRTLTVEEYLAVEDRYVRAVARFMRAAALDALRVRRVERWEQASAAMAARGLAFSERPAPREGQEVGPGEVEELVRRCLREVAWMELEVPHVFLIHVGFDLRLVIATRVDPAQAVVATRADGLFTYPGTLDLDSRWGATRGGSPAE